MGVGFFFFFLSLGVCYYLLFFSQDESAINTYNSLGETGSHILVWVFSVVFGIIAQVIWGGDRNKTCAWCDTTLTNEGFVSGNKGVLNWKHRNKDGSKDKRFKDNYQEGIFTSKFKCKECGAETQFVHEMSRNPGVNASIRLRKLLSEGEGERKGSDIE